MKEKVEKIDPSSQALRENNVKDDEVNEASNSSNLSPMANTKKKKNKKSKKKSKSGPTIDAVTEETNALNMMENDHANNDETEMIEDLRIIKPLPVENLEEKLSTLPDYFSPNGDSDIVFVNYTDESILCQIQALVSKDLSEPYSIFTYRYFLQNWPKLCICAFLKSKKMKDDGEGEREREGEGESGWWRVFGVKYETLLYICNEILSLYHTPQLQWISPLVDVDYFKCVSDRPVDEERERERERERRR